MKMVRHWMIKPFKRDWRLSSLLTITALAVLSSCNPTEIQPSLKSGQVTYDGSYANRAFIYTESPAIMSGPKYGPAINIDGFTNKSNPQVITSNNQLTGNCSMQFNYYYIPYRSDLFDDECVHSYGTKGALETLIPRQADGTWVFPAGSKEFYQVNALYHIQKGVDTFFSKLNFAYKKLHGTSTLSAVPKSIPSYLKTSNLWWFKGVSSQDSQHFKNEFLTSYALCNSTPNAYFSPAGPELCFGSDPSRPNFHIVQDPSVIYHELGHALVSVMMNLRNGTNTSDYTTFRSNLNTFGYDEAGSLGEGIADYYSYVINGRTHIGEWALGRFDNQSRPLTESDPLHISGLDTTPEGRLSYPQYLLYDPNEPNSPFEDVHYAGQIVSHYLVALTETLKNKCTPEADTSAQDTATSYVMLLLAETLSELGDLRAVGIDFPTSAYYPSAALNRYFNNLDPSSSYTWAHLVNPPTYRRFFQIFAKNIKKLVADSGKFCSSFTLTESERLLDDYGLLLFKNYNDNGNSTKLATVSYRTVSTSYPVPTLTTVTEGNRRKSTLISKSLLSLATVNTTVDRSSYYIVDDATTMQAYLSNLLFKGIAVTLSSSVAGTVYNNDNIKISPGEIVAVIPNLYNASNSTMAGVQILANDWDHMDYDATTGYYKPCVVDTVTTVDQGAIPATSNTCSSTMKEHKRYVPDPNNGNAYPTEAAQPVCMVQMDEGTSTRWVSQNEFRTRQPGLTLTNKDCLGYSANGTSTDEDFSFNPNECLVRILPGSNDANFSKIAPQKSYIETIRSSSNQNTFNVGNAIVMEVNKWIPPGTKFRCRLRARFSNCSDCYTDASNVTHPGDDYMDYDYNGEKPFKVINFEFDIND